MDDCVVDSREIYQTLGRLVSERRKRVKITQEALAKSLGLSRASVTNIERGKQPVQLHLIFKIAEILNIGVLELIPMPGSGDETHPIQVEEWLGRIQIAKSTSAASARIPNKARGLTRTRMTIEKTVRELLRKNHIFRPPVPVDSIAHEEGIELRHAPTGINISGALIRSPEGTFIAINDAHHPNRQRFTIAHELGHYYLSHSSAAFHVDEDFTVKLRDQKSSQATDSDEIAANAFAAELLMPRDFVIHDVADLLPLDSDVPRKLAKKYRVSEQAMTIRLVNLGFMSPM